MPEAALRILVVEDDTRLLSVLEDVLRAEGYDLRTARNGRLAVEQMSAFLPDVVVLDLEMPTMNGREFMTWMSDHNMTIPVIVASCNDDVVPSDLGAAAKLSKPYDLDQLLNAIAAIAPRTTSPTRG